VKECQQCHACEALDDSRNYPQINDPRRPYVCSRIDNGIHPNEYAVDGAPFGAAAETKGVTFGQKNGKTRLTKALL